jgi:hypothetical protein
MEFKGTNEEWFLSGLEIVSMPSQVKICKVSGNTYDEAKANALLISKAPEMLNMLQKLYLDYKIIIPYFPRRDEISKDIENLIKEATELEQ